MMNLKSVKQELTKIHVPVWKLIRTIGTSRNNFYSKAHVNFKGFESPVLKALRKLKGGEK